MWDRLARIIIRNRIIVLIVLGLITAFFGYNMQYAKMSYKFQQVLPKSDTIYKQYDNFKKIFGQEGSLMVIGTNDSGLKALKNFDAWYDLTNNLDSLKGVKQVLSIANLYNIKKNTAQRKFQLVRLVKNRPKTQAEVDSLLGVIHDLPFYSGYLYNQKNDATLIAVNLDRKYIDSKLRKGLFEKINKIIADFKKESSIKNLHISGLPFIRVESTTKMVKEIKLFCVLLAIITSIIMIFFFRSFKVMIFSLLVVVVGMIWCVGFVGLMGYPITILTGLLPPLIIVIGIPNCIYILNKYQREYKSHGNQIKAIHRVIKKTGNATFMTNATTAIGFGTIAFTSNDMMIQFGISSFISIMMLFVLAITLVPIIYSFLKPPKARHSKHLEKGWVVNFVSWVGELVTKYRKWIYALTIILIGLSIYGATLMKTTGRITDDIPHNGKVYSDLQFFQKDFNGVLPLEVMVDFKKPRSVNKLYNLKKIERLQKVLGSYPELSKPVSIVDGLKFIKQAFYNGNKNKYELINNRERAFFAPYLSSVKDKNNLLKAFVDSTKQRARISVRMTDMGTARMDALLKNVRLRIDSIFNPQKYNVILTGTSVLFFKGTAYLIDNLYTSIGIAIIIIALLMAALFSSFRMVAISLIPNILPLLTTAGFMGFFGIPLKPSTIIVFSVAFGISIDSTIRFLAKYRQEIKSDELNIKGCTLLALKEVGISIIYSSIVLCCGFGIFMFSDFGGTQALGLLVSLTLLISMFSNLILLPCLLLSFDKLLLTKSFKSEALIEIYDEEEDIDVEELQIHKMTDKNEDL